MFAWFQYNHCSLVYACDLTLVSHDGKNTNRSKLITTKQSKAKQKAMITNSFAHKMFLGGLCSSPFGAATATGQPWHRYILASFWGGVGMGEGLHTLYIHANKLACAADGVMCAFYIVVL